MHKVKNENLQDKKLFMHVKEKTNKDITRRLQDHKVYL